MTVTPLQYQRHAAAEASQLRMTRLLRMSYPELHRLLAGDPRETAAWVRSAAEHGVIEAQLLLGRMALEGQGMAPNPAEALHWFTVAAARGDAEAMNMLGRAHELGWGTEIDLPAAAAWYKRSADGAHDWGEYNYANMLFDGLGLTMDRGQAVVWYRRAANRGHGRAMNLLGRCLEEGWGTPRDAAAAAIWYRRSAETGYFRGQFNHGAILIEQRRYGEAARWLRQAAEGGNAEMRQTVLRLLAGNPAFQFRRDQWIDQVDAGPAEPVFSPGSDR